MLTTCCQMPRMNNRCTGCGHRQSINGVAPKQTRDIAKTKPWFVAQELYGRHEAKAYGRQLLSSGQFSKV